MINPEVRTKVVDYLRANMLGPEQGASEQLIDRPDRKYLVGTLYPQQSLTGNRITDEDGDELDVRDAGLDEPVVLANEWQPASLGFSFYTSAESLVVTASCGVYEQINSSSGQDVRWARRALAPITIPVPAPPGRRIDSEPIMDGRALMTISWRPLGNGRLITLAVTNQAVCRDGIPATEDCLFQVELAVQVESGRVEEYPALLPWMWISGVWYGRVPAGVGRTGVI